MQSQGKKRAASCVSGGNEKVEEIDQYLHFVDLKVGEKKKIKWPAFVFSSYDEMMNRSPLPPSMLDVGTKIRLALDYGHACKRGKDVTAKFAFLLGSPSRKGILAPRSIVPFFENLGDIMTRYGSETGFRAAMDEAMVILEDKVKKTAVSSRGSKQGGKSMPAKLAGDSRPKKKQATKKSEASRDPRSKKAEKRRTARSPVRPSKTAKSSKSDADASASLKKVVSFAPPKDDDSPVANSPDSKASSASVSDTSVSVDPKHLPNFQTEIWPILQKLGFKSASKLYCRPGGNPKDGIEGRDYFANAHQMRRYLCAYGMNLDKGFELEEDEQAQLATWIRYATIPSLRQKTVIPDVGGDITGREAHKYLMDLGFTYRNNYFFLPGVTPISKGGLYMNGFSSTNTDETFLWTYLARFGLPQTKDTRKRELTENEMLRLQLFIADAPGFHVLAPKEHRKSDPVVGKPKKESLNESSTEKDSSKSENIVTEAANDDDRPTATEDRSSRTHHVCSTTSAAKSTSQESSATLGAPTVVTHSTATSDPRATSNQIGGSDDEGGTSVYDEYLNLQEDTPANAFELSTQPNDEDESRPSSPHSGEAPVASDDASPFSTGESDALAFANSSSVCHGMRGLAPDRRLIFSPLEKADFSSQVLTNPDASPNSKELLDEMFDQKLHAPPGSTGKILNDLCGDDSKSLTNSEDESPSEKQSFPALSAEDSSTNVLETSDASKEDGILSVPIRAQVESGVLVASAPATLKRSGSPQSSQPVAVGPDEDGGMTPNATPVISETTSWLDSMDIETDEEWQSVLAKVKQGGVRIINGPGLVSYYCIFPGGKHPKKGGKHGIDYVNEYEGLQEYLREHTCWVGDGAENEGHEYSPAPKSISRAQRNAPAGESNSLDCRSPPEQVRFRQAKSSPQKLLTPPEKKKTVSQKLKSCLGVLKPNYDIRKLTESRTESISDSTHASQFEVNVGTVTKFLHDVITSNGSESGRSDPCPSLYICGSPGVGKTSAVQLAIVDAKKLSIEEDWREGELPPTFCFVNAVHIQDSARIYDKIVESMEIDMTQVTAGQVGRLFDTQRARKSRLAILVVDEIDSLLADKANTAGEKTLETLFGWASKTNLSFALIGISNAVSGQKTSRFERLGMGKNKVVFRPYQSDELVRIVEDRIGRTIVHPAGVEWASKKVAASSGDARQVLELVATAVEKCLESLPSDKGEQRSLDEPVVTIRHIMQANRANLTSAAQRIEDLPHMANVVLCVAVTLRQVSDHWKVITLGTLQKYCRQASASRMFGEDEVSIDDFASLVTQLVDAGLLLPFGRDTHEPWDAVARSGNLYNAPVELGVQLHDVESVLNEKLCDHDFYGNLLSRVRAKDVRNEDFAE